MPLPFILGAAAIAVAGYGAKKGYDGYQDSSEADDIIQRANICRDELQNRQEEAKSIQDMKLQRLGELEFEIVNSLKEFRRIFGNLSYNQVVSKRYNLIGKSKR